MNKPNGSPAATSQVNELPKENSPQGAHPDCNVSPVVPEKYHPTGWGQLHTEYKPTDGIAMSDNWHVTGTLVGHEEASPAGTNCHSVGLPFYPNSKRDRANASLRSLANASG